MSKMDFQGISKLQVNVLCETLLTSGKGFPVQDANVAAGKNGQKFIMRLLPQEMKWQHKELICREKQKFQCTGVGAEYIKGVLKRINTMFYSKR